MDPHLLAMLLAVTSAGGVLGPIAHDPRLLQAEAAMPIDEFVEGAIKEAAVEEFRFPVIG